MQDRTTQSQTALATHPCVRVAVLCISLCFLSHVRAGYIIVTSSQNRAVEQAAESCLTELSTTAQGVQRVSIEDITDELLLSSESNTFIAIGSAAAVRLAQSIPDDSPFYYGLTPTPGLYGLDDRAGSSGISAEVSFEDKARIITSVLPDARRIGTLYSSSSEPSRHRVQQLQGELAEGWSLLAIDIDSYDNAIDAVRAMLQSDLDLVVALPDPVVYNSAIVKSVLLESLKSRTPVFGFSRAMVRAGALLGSGIDPNDQGKALAELITEGKLDIHTTAEPRKYLNQIVAARLGIEISDSVTESFDEVFE